MRRTLAVGVRRVDIEVRQFFRDRGSAVFNFALPMVLLVIFGSVFGSQKLGETSISLAQYFLAGMIASGVLYTSFQNLAIAIPMEREDGTLKRLKGTPMPLASYFLGKIGMVFVAYAAQLVIVLAVGLVLYQVDLPRTPGRWLVFGWVSLLGLTACTLLGIAFSVVPRHGKGASAIVAPVVLVFQFTSGVFFRFIDLPRWMQQFSAVFPLKWLTQAMRYVFLPDEGRTIEATGRWELGKCALVLGAWVVAGFVLAVSLFRWSPRGE